MPKDRRSLSLDRHRTSPYSRCYGRPNSKRRKLPIGNKKEWEETRCPICLDHPHNAVMLLCSSRAKGCIPYLCDTSSRHSNCLDQFRKPAPNSQGEKPKLVCPLCRGDIGGWTVVEAARQVMNSKTRSCSTEKCEFEGNYSELRRHARQDHPSVRPTEVKPEQERDWTRLEEETEQRDILSMQLDFDADLEDFLTNELASPDWDYDMDFTPFDSGLGSFSPAADSDSDSDSETDIGSPFLDHLDDLLTPPPIDFFDYLGREPDNSRESDVQVENLESSRPRRSSRSRPRLWAGSRENTSRRRRNDFSYLVPGLRRRRPQN